MRWGERPCDGLVEIVKCASCELQHRGLGKSSAFAAAHIGRVLGRLGDGLRGRFGTAIGMSALIAHNLTMQRDLLSLLDRFVVLNQATFDLVVQNGGDGAKLSLNYLGLSHRRYSKKGSPEAAPTVPPVKIGFLGRMVGIKGILDLVRAVRALPMELPIRVELRGPASPEQDVVGQIAAVLGNDRRVQIAPAASPGDVPGILAGYDVLCVPSVCFEGGPTVVSEAHAVGTPVIGTRIGAMPELIRDGVDGALVEPGDWRALAAVLKKVAIHPEATVDRWRRALPSARTMEDIVADYETLYADILTVR